MRRWTSVPLGELIYVFRYGTSKKSGSTGFPVLRIPNVVDGQLSLEDLKYVALPDAEADRLRLRDGDLLFVRSNGNPAYVGRCAVFDSACFDRSGTQAITVVYASYLIMGRPDRQKVHPKYLQHFLSSRGGRLELRRKCRTSAGQYNINIAGLSSVLVPLPPLHEQERIVETIEYVNSIRRLRCEAREKARQIIPAMFIEMFGDPGENSKRWPLAAVGELLESADYGTSQKASEEAAGVPVLRMGNVTATGDLLLDELKYVDLPAEDYQKHRLEPGDILFNRTNSKELVGKTGIWNGAFDAVAASYFIRLRVHRDRTDPWYLWAFLNSRYMKRRLFETARGAIGQANINAKEVRAFPIPVPPIDLQHAFAERVADIQSIIAQQDRMATVSEQMVDALMAKVFQ